MSSLSVEQFNFRHKGLMAIKYALQQNLKDDFRSVEVTISQCPDMSAAPFNLAAKGFGAGTTGIVDLGGPAYLLPVVNRSKVYDLAQIIPKTVGSSNFSNGWYLSGAGAGPWPSQGANCEMVVNMKIGSNGQVESNKSRVALYDDHAEEEIVVRRLDKTESRCALLANLMVSSGIQGKIIEIRCSQRYNPGTNFTTSIRASLAKAFGKEPVGLTGVFLIKNSPTLMQVMDDFSPKPLESQADIDKWLQFFDMDPPVLCQSVLVSTDPGFDLRTEHSHGWSLKKGCDSAGHYHYDLNPKTVEYHGFFAVAETLWRIDRPKTGKQ